MDNRRSWELEAERWVTWARTPGHDAYWYYRDAFFDHIVPPPGQRTLEVGCGEGRVTRDLTSRGHRVIALDGSPTLLHHAKGIDLDGRYVLADAVTLPIPTASIDLVVAYNSLMDFDQMSATVGEVARVLQPGGHFCICITHPILDAGAFEGEGPDAPYLLRCDYFPSQPFDETVERGGLSMRFKGWSHSLEAYVSALSGSGLVIDALREPKPRPGMVDRARWSRYPMFLHLRAIKPGPSAAGPVGESDPMSSSRAFSR